jgi:hypothetical protein
MMNTTSNIGVIFTSLCGCSRIRLPRIVSASCSTPMGSRSGSDPGLLECRYPTDRRPRSEHSERVRVHDV